MAIKMWLIIVVLAAIEILAENEVERCDLKKQGEKGYYSEFNKCVEAKKDNSKKDQFVNCIESLNITKNPDETFKKTEITTVLDAMKYPEPNIRTELETAFNACANNSTLDNKAILSCQVAAANKICKSEL